MSISSILCKQRLRWLGHVHRMDDQRLPKQILYALTSRCRKRGRPKLRYNDICKRDLKVYHSSQYLELAGRQLIGQLGKEKQKYATPWDYPRLLVHSNRMGKGRPFRGVSDERQYNMRVIVSRDPFSRVLSSYLDKFYLPDFWLMLGVGFKAKDGIQHHEPSESQFFKDHFKEMDKQLKGTYKAGFPRDCASRLTFSQFLRNGLNIYEPHWLPVHSICNPCKLKPTHVIHMDTFTQDARVVLKQMGMDHFLDGFDPVQQTNTEINTIVTYNFDRIFVAASRTEFQGCVSKEELAYRLWHNFQWRGYIHPDYHYVIPGDQVDVKEDLLSQLAKAREAAIKDPDACKKYKSDFKINAFRSLPKSLYQNLVNRFTTDSKLFGYEETLVKMTNTLYT